MTIRDQYYGGLTMGPFLFDTPTCVLRTECCGATWAVSEQEGRQLGRALLKAISDEESSAEGPWEVEVLDDDWDWEGCSEAHPPVCVIYEDRFEWILSWRSAEILAEDYEVLECDEER